MPKFELQDSRLSADFNGCFGELLCLSHGDSCRTEDGTEVKLVEGMLVTAYEEDIDDAGGRDDLIATGVVEQSPEELSCAGSRWCLRFDENGIRHESEV